ncbi:MAG: DUF1801 domain-containing protein [Chitinophagaceae bacterium]|nr:DUF1801 domain-containing protein [Chitinophagaceae bacterium]
MRNVDDYIDALSSADAELVSIIRNIILSAVPGIEERLSFKIPFYHYYGMLLYITKTKQGIDVTFCRGKDLAHEYPQLQKRNRAIAASVVIRDPKDITAYQLRELVAAAVAWNKEAAALKIPFVVKRLKAGKNAAAKRKDNQPKKKH